MNAARRGPVPRWQWWVPVAALAAVVYPPLLFAEPGQVVADTRSYLYLDPGRLLSRATSMWDPQVGLGTVPNQQIGLLWPMGPFFWLTDAIGLPDWLAQRLWIGSILVAAGGGVVFLARTFRWRPTAAGTAAFVYALSPFVLIFAARSSVLLLPFAGLPWLLALAIRASRTRGWRHPALFALVVATVGSVNATALVLVGIVPAAWILYAVWSSERVSRTRGSTTLAKIGLLTVAVNLWWISGLSVQATNGLDVLRYTQTADVVADASTAPEVLRGLGFWSFYGGDRLGQWVEPGEAYTQQLWLLGLTYAIPALGLLALGVVRWRHRTFVIGMLAIGTIVAVGAHPWDDPSILGTGIRALLTSDVGMAMRSLPRVVPLIALGSALGLGSAVGAIGIDLRRTGLVAAGVTILAAYLALPPLWTGGFVPENLRRDEDIPDYWYDVAAAIDSDEGSAGTRVLEIPGSEFASYRWGTTVDPVTPGLIDRPYAARELIPAGSPASADLLGALDRRLQEQTLEPAALAAVARLMNVGDIVLRNDLKFERYNTARPRTVSDLVARSRGLGDPEGYGPTVENAPVADARLVDETHLATDGLLPDPPAVEVAAVDEPVPMVRTDTGDRMVILSGDGDGIVDAAAAGLIDGTELLVYSASVTDDPTFVTSDLVSERALIVTDTNRARGERWTTIRHTQGYTEQPDGGILTEDLSDNRLPVFEPRDGIASVSEQRGMSARATDYGNSTSYTPEERPANAADGDPTTAWRTAAFSDAVGERIELQADGPVTTDEVTLLQPTSGEINRWITEVELRFDGDDPLRVSLDETSRRGSGQTVDIGQRTFGTLSIEILADTAGRRPGYGGLTSVGFAEVAVADLRLDELVRMPSDLLTAGGFRTRRYPLAIVQTRQRSVASDVTRDDEEHAIARAIELPTQRQFRLDGAAHLSSRAPAAVVDALLGRQGIDAGQPSVTATSVLPGGRRSLPSNVLDGDAGTRWTSAFGIGDDQSLDIALPAPVTVDTFTLTFADDDEHSVPRTVRVAGREGQAQAVPVGGTTANADGTRTATIDLDTPIITDRVLVGFDIEPRTTVSRSSPNPVTLPLAVAELGLGDAARVPPYQARIDTGCRTDLVTLDGNAVAVRVTGSTADALAGHSLEVTACEPAIVIPGGDHDMRAAPGRDTGLDLDQLVWCSAGGGGACTDDGPLLPTPVDARSAPGVDVTSENAATITVDVDGATVGEPFWLVLGQSFNDGWDLTEAEIVHEPTRLVNGFANGFLVTPDEESFTLTLRFTPQNRVDIAFLLSLIGAGAALLLALTPAREIAPAPISQLEPLRRIRALGWEGALPTRREAVWVGIGAGIVGVVVVNPFVGAALGILASLATRREGWRPAFTVFPSIGLALCGLYAIITQFRNEHPPGLDWLGDTGRLHTLALASVIMLAADVAIERVWVRGSDLQ